MKRGRTGALLGRAAVAAVATLMAILFYNICRSADMRDYPAAASPGEERRVILLVVDRLDYLALRAGAGPVLASLLETGAVALMNARAGRSGSESAYLSLGTGARAVAGAEGNRAYQVSEQVDGCPAEILFQRYTGAAPRGQVFHLHAPILQERNNALGYPVTVGLLGRHLAENGLTAAVVGNADGAGPGRGVVMIAMDPAGEVPLGEVGPGMLAEDPLFPFGKRTDPLKLAEAVRDSMEHAHLVVADFGDFSRLDDARPRLAPDRRDALFAQTMERLDRFLREVVVLVKDGTVLMVVTPSPPVNQPGAGEHLLPFVLVEDSGSGLLGSSTTRRAGLITNTDVAPMIYSYLSGSALTGADGQAVNLESMVSPLSYLDRFFEHSVLVFRLRPPLVKGFILALVVVLLAGLAGLVLRLSLVARLFFILDGLMLVPLVLLLLPGLTRFPLPSPFQTGVLLAGSVLLAVLVLHPLKRQGRRLFWTVAGLATALALVADILAGSPLQQASFLGYDPIAGARYYGIGNEYMGALIGSAVLGTVSLAGFIKVGGGPAGEPRRSFALMSGGRAPFYPAVLLFYGLIIFILATPRFGANLGGTVSAAVAFGVAWAGLGGPAGKARLPVLTVSLFLLYALGLLLVFNFWWQPDLPSHLGHFGQMVRSRGFAGFQETVLRKIDMNWKLIRYSIWSRAFVTLLGLLVLLFFYPIGFLRRLKEEEPDLVLAATAGLAGSITALLINDSGIVAAAMVLLYIAPPLLITIIGKSLETSNKKDAEEAG